MPAKIRIRTAMLCLLCSFMLPLFARAANPPDAQPVILIENATILTVSHGTIEKGSVLIKDGKIAEVGSLSRRRRMPRFSTPRASSSYPASSIATRTSPLTAA